MRIIAGEFRGRTLKVLDAAALRPTGDRVREAAFSTLLALRSLTGARVLDLYSGTGAIAFEALSRGAESATAVELNPLHARMIQENAASFGVESRLTVRVGSALDFLSQAGGEFDLIFADPPYAEHPGQVLLNAITKSQYLARDGVVVIEHPRKLALMAEVGLCFVKRKDYGDTALSLFRPGGNQQSEDENTGQDETN